MSEHKYNPTAIAAKNGEIPPKERSKLSKRQVDALIYKRIQDVTGVTDIQRALHDGGSFYN